MRNVILVCSLDVEEEGLFRGSYAVHGASVDNIGYMHRLAPLLKLGVRPTLFCAHSVLKNDQAWRQLEILGSRFPLEFGAHLHHWNTPPIVLPGSSATKVPSSNLSSPILAQKLDTLLEAGRMRTGNRPTSFRMGKWDLLQAHWPVLAEAGILADASVRPLHATNATHTRPDHFRAPQGPYVVTAAGREVFEMPLTVTPISPWLSHLVETPLLRKTPLKAKFEQWGALSLLPVYHPLWAMKAVTALAVARGQDVISLTWHSSEMMPGCNPVLATPGAVARFLYRLEAYVEWMCSKWNVSFMTLDDLRRARSAQATRVPCTDADWSSRLCDRDGGNFPR